MLALMYARNATQRNGPIENILTILWITCCISFTACYTIQKLVTFCKIVTKREILLRTIPLIFFYYLIVTCVCLSQVISDFFEKRLLLALLVYSDLAVNHSS